VWPLVCDTSLVCEWPFVVGRKGAAKRFHTAVALKGKRNSIADPANMGAKIPFMVPWMWCKGSKWSR
jgi:hypothetical protein